MGRNVQSAVDVLLDRSPGEWIGGLLIALALSIALTLAFISCRKTFKESPMVLTVLALLFNFAGIAVATGYSGVMVSRPIAAPDGKNSGSEVSPDIVADSVIDGMAMRILISADADHNGILSTKEAVAASERFVNGIESEANGPLDHRMLGSALKRRIKPPGVHRGLPSGTP